MKEQTGAKHATRNHLIQMINNYTADRKAGTSPLCVCAWIQFSKETAGAWPRYFIQQVLLAKSSF